MDLAVKTREITGKKVRALRREGMVPAELYGHGIKNMHLMVPVKDFAKIFKEAGQTSVVTLSVGTEKRPVMIHEVSRDFLTGDFLHVDFHQIRMDEKITAKVPFVFINESPAVKEKSAIINKAILEIEVEALPAEMPHEITVDLSNLKDVNESIYVKDIPHPRGVKFLIDETSAIVTATEQKPEEVVEVAPIDVADVKVETEEKKAERQEAKTKDEKTDKAA